MTNEELQKLEPGELFLLDDGRIAVVVRKTDDKLTYVTCSDTFLTERVKKNNRLLVENQEAFLKMLVEDQEAFLRAFERDDDEEDDPSQSHQPSDKDALG